MSLNTQHVCEILDARFEADQCEKLAQIYPPSMFKDMDKTALRIEQALSQNEHITVVGDYDADGVTASYILSTFLKDIGAKCSLIIPNRFRDGYGFSVDMAQKIEPGLVITVDNGITSLDATNVCMDKGIDVIITDHHTTLNELPNAYAIVNPKQKECTYPNAGVCGAQIAWFVCAAVKKKMTLQYDLAAFLDVLSIAIVADMMPLQDINRVMVKEGIKRLSTSKRPYIRAIKEAYGKESIKTEDVSFLIAPLINSAGRMEDANLSYDLMCAVTMEEAHERLDVIKSLNMMRKEIEADITKRAKHAVRETDNFIVVWDKGWHEGVIGIVASRISRHFKKPTIVLSVENGIAKGSGRSFADVDIFSLIKQQDDLLLGFGGHTQAAGVSLKEENLEAFRDAINVHAPVPKEKPLMEREDILGDISWDILNLDFIDVLERYEPYGMQNPRPMFVVKGAYVKSQYLIGADKNHSKFVFVKEGKQLDGIFFNYAEVKEGEYVDILFSLNKNEFRGKVTPQLMIEEII